MIEKRLRSSFALAAEAVKQRSEEINKLNVFPVPDGDTGTNMALTLATVVKELEQLPGSADIQAIAKAITHGSLMGARGNSGVITSQILRGLSEGVAEAGLPLGTPQIAAAFRRAVKVAFQAVRKPVEGTILTVLRDVSKCADAAEKRKLEVPETLDSLVAEAYNSVARTPDLLPVLKENGVVDSGAFGFAVFLEAFFDAIQGRTSTASAADAAMARANANARVAIELNDDWEGSEYRYCTEFLFRADAPIDEDGTRAFLSTQGDCELLVGNHPDYKIHVHTDTPNNVLAHMLELGQIYNVFIHNMDMEAKERTEKIAQDKMEEPRKPLGAIAVAASSGTAEILRSLGVDVVVEGGQTMNPSTADILEAAQAAHAESVIVLPNNGNIVMAAQSAAAAANFPIGVVLTRSVLQGFSAMFSYDPEGTLEQNIEAMSCAITAVHDGEITTAVRDSQAADGTPIHAGDVIGIADDSIIVVGSDVSQVALEVAKRMQKEVEGDTLTLLAGCDFSDEELENLVEQIEDNIDIEVDPHRGEQPLYPVIFSIE